MRKEILNGIENIIGKYYWHFNTEEVRSAIAAEVKMYLIQQLGENKINSIRLETNGEGYDIYLKD